MVTIVVSVSTVVIVKSRAGPSAFLGEGSVGIEALDQFKIVQVGNSILILKSFNIPNNLTDFL